MSTLYTFWDNFPTRKRKVYTLLMNSATKVTRNKQSLPREASPCERPCVEAACEAVSAPRPSFLVSTQLGIKGHIRFGACVWGAEVQAKGIFKQWPSEAVKPPFHSGKDGK